jgi:hypothetical protein
MNFQTVVNDLKTRMDALTAQGQEVVKVLPDTLKQANDIVLQSFESLVKSEGSGAKELFASARASFEKARMDGLMAVVSSPVEYLPPRDKLVDVFNETFEIFSKTGDELYKTFKSGLAPQKKTTTHKKHKKTTKKSASATHRARKTRSAPKKSSTKTTAHAKTADTSASAAH